MVPLSKEIRRFAGVGCIATLAHVTVAFLVSRLQVSIDPLISNTIGFGCSALVTYFGNYYWTFTNFHNHGHSLGRFVVMASVAFSWTSLIVYVTGSLLGWSFVVALVIILLTTPPLTFTLSKHWVFRSSVGRYQWIELEIFSMIVLLVLATWYYSGTVLNHDTSWYLIATARWLDGASLYHNIMEINPPLAFYLTAPAVMLSRALAISPMPAFVLTVFVAITLSISWSRRLLYQSALLSRMNTIIMLAAIFLATCLSPVSNFGQREHLMIIFVLPYIILSVFRPTIPIPERLAIGFLALLGLALKPYFLVLPLLMAILMILRSRQLWAAFTPEHLVIGIGYIGYAIFILVTYPDYFQSIVPIGHLVYESYGIHADAILRLPALLSLFLIGGLLATPLPWRRTDRMVGISLTIVVCAFVAAYFIQFKGWEYQRIPIHSMLWVAMAWVGLTVPWTKLKYTRLKAASTTLLGFAAMLLLISVPFGSYKNAATDIYAPFFEQLGSERSFLALTSNVSFSFPMGNLQDASVTSRYSALWLIPGAITQLDSEQEITPARKHKFSNILEFARRTTTEDLTQGEPKIVFVDVREHKPYFGGTPFDYLAFFTQDEEFRRAWESYRLIDTVAGYEIWRRIH